MPIGRTTNWIRALAALNGFHVRYGYWPTWLPLFPGALHNIRYELFTQASLDILESKLTLISDPAAPIIAEDDAGNSPSHGKDDSPKVLPSPSAQEWLGVAPTPPSHTMTDLATSQWPQINAIQPKRGGWT